jgi:sirohydrochlorin ferrochelatase
MHRVLEQIRARGVYPIIQAGFLECNRPTIPESVAECIRLGADRIDAVPYFLHTGKHVARDLPAILDECRNRYPDVEFRLSDFLGRSIRITDILARRAADIES